ncbi:MAG: class I SAM-dependent methyltransferase [Planctomycetota bacterium]|jgi:hypothetical protein
MSCRFCANPLLPTGDVCNDREDLKIGRCQACNLVQTVDVSHVRIEYYASDSYLPEDLDQARARERAWNVKRVAYIKDLIPNHASRNVLDFACGSGGFLQQAQGVFASLTGYDLSPRLCQENQAAGWRCTSNIEEVPEDVDLIVLFHVLEHVPAPWIMLTDLQQRFPKAWDYVIEVPNTDEALNSVFQNEAYRRNHFSADHVNYFTSDTLRMVVEQAGLEVVVDTQLQRYTLANNLGWITCNEGGGQDLWPSFNDAALNEEYERVLVSQRAADSIFFVCRPHG